MLAFPIGTDRPQRRFPWVNVLLIAANVVLFLITRNFGPVPPGAPGADGGLGYGITGMLPQWNKFLLNPAHPQVYQFISYQFLHENLTHIFFNMLFLYVFGNNLNEKLGHVGYLAFYLAGGVLAGLGHSLISTTPILGASGSISAVTGLFLLLLPRTHIRLFIWIFIYLDVWEIPSIFFILFKVGQDMLEPILGSTGVAYMAHLSGTLAGAVIGLFLLLTHLVQRDHYDLLAMLNRYRRRKTYESLVAKGYEPFQQTTAVAGGRPAGAGSAKGKNANPPIDPRIESLRTEISRLIHLHELPDATLRYRELRALDAAQILPEQAQLDVGNQLMADGHYADAATAYEDYLRGYPLGSQRDQITLMLGVIYARYLPRIDRAKELLQTVIPRLHNPRDRQMAQAELDWVQSQTPNAGPSSAVPPPAPGANPV